MSDVKTTGCVNCQAPGEHVLCEPCRTRFKRLVHADDVAMWQPLFQAVLRATSDKRQALDAVLWAIKMERAA